MEISRNQQFISFLLSVVLNIMIKSHTNPLHLSQNMNHPFVYAIYTTCHLVPQLFQLADQLLRCCSACVQATLTINSLKLHYNVYIIHLTLPHFVGIVSFHIIIRRRMNRAQQSILKDHIHIIIIVCCYNYSILSFVMC